MQIIKTYINFEKEQTYINFEVRIDFQIVRVLSDREAAELYRV